jgi:ATP adenylyltransferase
MDYLWTPWRYQYVTTTGDKRECVFCAAARRPTTDESLVVHRGAHNFVILNRFPTPAAISWWCRTSTSPRWRSCRRNPGGDDAPGARQREASARDLPSGRLNLGMNLGRSAGAGIAEHVHMHVLPRWTGDTSFITTVGETRVVPRTSKSPGRSCVAHSAANEIA